MNIISRINSKRRARKLRQKRDDVERKVQDEIPMTERLADSFEIEEVLSVEEVPQDDRLPDEDEISSVCSDPNIIDGEQHAAVGSDGECISEGTFKNDLECENEDGNEKLTGEKEVYHSDTESTDDDTVESSTKVSLQCAKTRPMIVATVDHLHDHDESSSAICNVQCIESKDYFENIIDISHQSGYLSSEESASNMMSVIRTSGQNSDMKSSVADAFLQQVIKTWMDPLSLYTSCRLLLQIKLPVLIPYNVYRQLTEGLILSIYLYIQLLEGSSLLLESNEQEKISLKDKDSCRIPAAQSISRIDPTVITSKDINGDIESYRPPIHDKLTGRIVGLIRTEEPMRMELAVHTYNSKPNQAMDLNMNTRCDPGETASVVLQRLQVTMQERLVGETTAVTDKPILWRKRIKGMVSPIPSTACSIDEETDELSWSVFFEDLCDAISSKLTSIFCCQEYEDSLAMSTRQMRKQKMMEDYECVHNTNFIAISELLNRATKEGSGKYAISMPIVNQDSSIVWASLDLEGCHPPGTAMTPSVTHKMNPEFKSMKDMKHSHFKELGLEQQQNSSIIVEQSVAVYNRGLKMLTACQQLEANHKDSVSKGCLSN